MTRLPMNLFDNNYIYGFRHVNIKYVINNLKKKIQKGPYLLIELLQLLYKIASSTHCEIKWVIIWTRSKTKPR
jgi:hypothetical protein